MIIWFQIVLANAKLVWIILSMKVDVEDKSCVNFSSKLSNFKLKLPYSNLCYIFIFYLPINFKVLQDVISGIIFYIHLLSVNSDHRTLCFDLMFLNKINQVILVATLLFQCYKWSPSWRFTFSISYLSSRWMLFSDKQSYNQVNWNYMAKSRYQLTFCEFSEQLLHFHLLSTLKH